MLRMLGKLLPMSSVFRRELSSMRWTFLQLGCLNKEIWICQQNSIFRLICSLRCFMLHIHIWAKMGGDISLRSGHFGIWFFKCQLIGFCLHNSSVSDWGWILHLRRKCIFFNHYDFIFALIFRHFIGLVRYYTGRRELWVHHTINHKP